MLLVIHGAGPEAWRAATPKAKFVIINLPFKQIAVKKLSVKKKTVMAIYAEETGGDRDDLCHFLGRQEISVPAHWLQHGE